MSDEACILSPTPIAFAPQHFFYGPSTLPAVRLEHRCLIIMTGECFYGSQGLKQVHCDKLGFVFTVLAENVTTEVTVYGLKSWVDHFLQ